MVAVDEAAVEVEVGAATTDTEVEAEAEVEEVVMGAEATVVVAADMVAEMTVGDTALDGPFSPGQLPAYM